MQPTTTPTLSEKVKHLKTIAENAIRMKMLLSYLSNIEYVKETIELQTKAKAADQLAIDSATYDLTKLDTNHPNIINMKVQAEKDLELLKVDILQYDAEFVLLAQLIKGQEDGASDIENGKTKVNPTEVETLTKELIKKDAHNQV